MISIIIPAYNASKTIKQCLASISNQNYQDFKIIVVDDGSTDNTWQLLTSLKNNNPNPDSLFLIHNSTNQGANAARNRGVKEAKGDYLLFCDADIVMRHDMLEKMVCTLEQQPEASYAYSSFKFGWKTFKLWPFSAKHLRQMPYIHTTSLIRATHFPSFDEGIKRLQDWDLWLTMLEQGHTGVWISEILFKIINTKGTMSQWIPSFLHKIPWKWLGIQPRAILRYNEAVARIKAKHKCV